jgi:hypothetical protein
MNNVVQCACGCRRKLEEKDTYGRKRKFISGHNNRKYEDPTQHKREWNHRNRKARFEYKTRYTHGLKVRYIALKGNECSQCNFRYNGKNACCFDFHHENPKLRKLGLNLSSIGRFSTKTILKELDKCVLLCANCHRKEHSTEY